MLGLYVWCIILIIIGICLLPWWVFPSMIVGGLIWFYIEYK